MNLWNQLAALFLPTRQLFGSDSAAPVRGGRLGGRQWVVARGECQYRRDDFRTLPAGKRIQAGRLAANRHRPATDSRVYTAWTGGIAHFWFWTVTAERLNAGTDQRWVPETLLQPAPATDGLRLLEMSNGYEAQYWRDGILSGSQWWAEMPSVDAWVRFVRAVGLDPALHAEVPVAQVIAWARQPWGEQTWAQRFAGAFHEKTIWLLLGAAFVFGLGWQLTALVRWQLADMRQADAVASARSAVAPLLDARDRAEQARGELLRLQALRAPVSDYVLMAEVAQHLPDGTRLVSWQREAGKLQAVVTGGGNDPRPFVAAFAGNRLLADVNATPQFTGGMQLTFTVPVAHVNAKGAPGD